MRTIIVGCGRVGAALASRLAKQGDDVTIIDLRTEAFDRLEEGFPGQAIRGDGTDEDVLRRAGADGADRFFALTEGDNRNVLAAQVATETMGIPTVVAKVNDPVRADAYASLGVATVCRTTMMVDALGQFLGMRGDPNAMRVRAATGHHSDAASSAVVIANPSTVVPGRRIGGS
jgi:trk system potassium uptake protein TrkA